MYGIALPNIPFFERIAVTCELRLIYIWVDDYLHENGEMGEMLFRFALLHRPRSASRKVWHII